MAAARAEPRIKRRVAAFMASRIRTARDAPLGDRPSVASELEAIFAPLPRIASPAEPAARPRRSRQRGTGLRLWLALLGAVALAALVGSLAFLMPVARQAPPRAPARPAIAHPPASRPVQRIVAPPQPAEQQQEQQQPLPQVTDSQPKAVPRHRPMTKHAAVPVHHGRCPRFATEAWCLHGTIMAADNRLRDAYRAAVRAGVDRRTLVDVRSDWKRLRGRANRDPEALIRGYALLTQELRAETGRARR